MRRLTQPLPSLMVAWSRLPGLVGTVAQDAADEVGSTGKHQGVGRPGERR